MLQQSLINDEKALAGTDTGLHPSSPQLTDIVAHYPHLETHCLSFNSQKTLPQTLAFNSRAFDFDQNNYQHLDQQLSQLRNRFNGIHKILIDHSEFQSDLHEKKKGFKLMEIDHGSLGRDFSNKVSIIGDITGLIDTMGHDSAELGELLETKFQEYYLERHYGSLNCDFGNLEIQERSCLRGSRTEEEKCILSKISQFESLIPESKITYSQEFCQTQGVGFDVVVEVPRIVEVEVPVIVYKCREVLVKQEESELSNNIDDIIDRFSQPYEQIYSNPEQTQENLKGILLTIPQTPFQSITPTLTPSYFEGQPQNTEIQLAYSDFPEEDNLKLPLDSYAQIESLISNSSRPNTERSFTPNDHEAELAGETVFITEKVVSHSAIEKFEESERALLEENSQLKEYISVLESLLQEGKRERQFLEKQNDKLAHRLQEQIQQTEYFSSRLEELNAELLEEKVLSLTHINESKQRKIQMLNNEIRQKSQEIKEWQLNFEQLREQLQASEILIAAKDDENLQLLRALEERDQEMNELTNCEENVIKLASQTQITLKSSIQQLQREKTELKENIKFYQQRLFDEGLSLHMQEATEIKGIIQQREYHFRLELNEVNKKYDQILGSYQGELIQLKNKLAELKSFNDQQNSTIQRQDKLREQCCVQFEGIVEEYHHELETKDQEILRLRSWAEKLGMGDRPELQLVIQRAYHSIQFLEKQLQIQRQSKANLSTQLFQLDQLVRACVPANKQSDHQARLLQEITSQLQKQMKENELLKEQLQSTSQQLIEVSTERGDQTLVDMKRENIRLRKNHEKLKKYTMVLEQDIKAVCGVKEQWGRDSTRVDGFALGGSCVVEELEHSAVY